MKIKRGSENILIEYISGDITASTLVFTMTDSQKATATRYIDTDSITQTYDSVSNLTKCVITLTSTDCMGLQQPVYFWDIRDENNKLLKADYVHIETGSRDDLNNTTVPNPTTVISADDFNQYDIMQVDIVAGVKVWVGKTKTEIQAYLDIDDLTNGLADEIVDRVADVNEINNQIGLMQTNYLDIYNGGF